MRNTSTPSPLTEAALRTAACVAFRHIDEINEHEREAVLVALVEVLPEPDAELAQSALFHFRKQRDFQLQLAGILGRAQG